MNGNGGPLVGAVPLGGPQLQIEKLTIYPAFAIDAIDDTPIGPPSEVHLRVVLLAEKTALLLPCDRQMLRAVGRQCMRIGGVPQAAIEPEDYGNDK